MAEQLCLPLTILFTQSLRASTLPSGWKGSHVIPVHKKGDYHLVDNYHPITLTMLLASCWNPLSRIICLITLLIYFFTPNQHGFLPVLPNSPQLLNIVDCGSPVDVVILISTRLLTQCHTKGFCSNFIPMGFKVTYFYG